MNAYIGTFQRKEMKYCLTAAQYRRITALLAARMEPDAYGSTRIDSLYLDTANRDMIARSLEKPLYKEKLRVRAYGSLASADAVFVEIKKKFKGVVYKRRIKMSAPAARLYVEGKEPFERACALFPCVDAATGETLVPTATDLQIAREIDALLARYPGIRPSTVTTCTRTAWAMKPLYGEDAATDAGTRVTFDAQIAYADLFARGEHARKRFAALMRPGDVLMEVKIAGAAPLWLADILSEVRAYPSSFSKYGAAYEAMCAIQAEPVAERVRALAAEHAAVFAQDAPMQGALAQGATAQGQAPIQEKTARARREAVTYGTTERIRCA